MVEGIRGAGIALLVLAAFFALAAATSRLAAFAVFGLAAGALLLRRAADLPALGRGPARAVIVIAVLSVAGGVVAAAVRVVDGVADTRVEYEGALDPALVRDAYDWDRLPAPGAITGAEATVAVQEPDVGLLVAWGARELAPWLLAAYVLALLIPVLRAAQRGDPFSDAATGRMSAIGMLLCLGIPGILLLHALVGRSAVDATQWTSPVAAPELSLSPVALLPGMLVLVLAAILRRGAELRDLERHTV